MVSNRRKKIAWTVIVVILFLGLGAFCVFSAHLQEKYVNPIAPAMIDAMVESIDAGPRTGNKPYALLVDGRTDFNGILAFNGFGDAWKTLSNFLWNQHNSLENDNTLFYRFKYSTRVEQAVMDRTWAASTDIDSSNNTTVMGQVLEKAKFLLQGISLEENEQRVDTVVIVTDDFFDLADMAISRCFFSVYDQFGEICKKYNVAVLSYSVDYAPPKPYEGQVKRPLYFVVISNTPSNTMNYCDALMEQLDPDHFVWNEPDLNSGSLGFTAVLAEKQQKSYKQIYHDGTKGFVLEREAEARTEPIVLQILLGEEGQYGRTAESFFSNPLAKYKDAIYWEVSCNIYELDRYGVAHNEIDNLVLLPLPDADDLTFINPEAATPEHPLLTYTIPAEALQALNDKEYDRYLCKIAIKPKILPEARPTMLHWVQNQALDSALTAEAEEVKAGVKPSLDMPSDMAEAMMLYNDIKDLENQPNNHRDRNTTKTLWLNRLVNYNNFVPAEQSRSAPYTAGFQVVLLIK